MYTASEREEAARDKLYKHVQELRESLLDLLDMVRASNDSWPASWELPLGEAEKLRERARQIEHRDHKIHRARAIIDGTKDDKELTGKLS